VRATWDYLKIDSENNDTLFPNPTDDFDKVSPTNKKAIDDNVVVYPKIENT
jgi:hypothetical protein